MIIINGAWNAIATQLKFILALVASGVGGCYPIAMIVSQEIVMGSQLLLSVCGEVYSNVHSVCYYIPMAGGEIFVT